MTDYTEEFNQWIDGLVSEAVAAATADIQADLKADLNAALVRADTAESEVATLRGQLESLQAEYDQYKLDHPEVTSGPDPAPEATQTAFGVNIKNGAAFKAALAQGTPLEAVRIFYNNKTPLPAHWHDDPLLSLLGTDQKFICISYKTDTPEWVEQFCSSVPAELRGNVWMVRHHEPENDNLDPAQFRYDQATHAAAVHGSGCKAAAVLMSWTLENASGRNFRDWINVISLDGLFWDAYNSGNKSKKGYESAAGMLDKAVEASKSVDLPWALCETGSLDLGVKDGKARIDWVEDVANYCYDKGALFATYFNRTTLDGSGDYTLTSEEMEVWTRPSV